MPGEDPSPTNDQSVRTLETRGYSGQFRTARDGRIECMTCGKAYEPERLRMETMVRVEGQSDPDDMTLIAGLRCVCGARGTTVFSYGVAADAMEKEALRRLEDARNRPIVTDEHGWSADSSDHQVGTHGYRRE
ncbi:MAG TPA: hypothetical protein VFH47_03150 [Candidatus Thermoplasmatota archaeon]|nr:hypothetical protein [Candidatus Thermoplasmatota archaeon]